MYLIESLEQIGQVRQTAEQPQCDSGECFDFETCSFWNLVH